LRDTGRDQRLSIDGVDDNKVDTNGPTQPVIQESVAEFTLLTNQFSAETDILPAAPIQHCHQVRHKQLAWRGLGDNRNRDLNAAPTKR